MVFAWKFLFIILITGLFKAFLPSSVSAAPLVEATGYERLARSDIAVYFLPPDRQVAGEYLDWAGQFRARPQWLAGRPLEGLAIYIAPSLEEFIRLSGGLLPEWGVACAIPGTDVVIVRSPRIVEIWREDPRAVLNHEIAHVFLDQLMAGAVVPRWFHEGYAQYVSQMWDLDSFLEFSVAILADRVFKLDVIAHGMPEGESQARMAYLQSYTVVEFMFGRWNESQMQLLFERWREMGDLDSALRVSLGLTLAQMEQLWLEWAGVRYGWLKLLTSATLMWIAAALLFVVIFIVRRRRYKLKLRAMQLRESRLAQSITPVRPLWRSGEDSAGPESPDDNGQQNTLQPQQDNGLPDQNPDIEKNM